MGGPDEPVVMWMEKHAVPNGGTAETLLPEKPGIVGDSNVGEGRRAGGFEFDTMLLTEGEEGVDPFAAALQHAGDAGIAFQDFNRFEGGRVGGGVVPKTAGGEDA